MIDTTIQLTKHEHPWLLYTGKGLVDAPGLARLMAELPDRAHYVREIKEGEGHRKCYNMSRVTAVEDGQPTALVAKLPAAWQELVSDVSSDAFRAWISQQVGLDVRALRLTVGLYVFENGDYTTVDTGKHEKALAVALYLNDEWAAHDGGTLDVWSTNDPAEPPAATHVPLGGSIAAMSPGPGTWHCIGPVRNGRTRHSLMIELWKD